MHGQMGDVTFIDLDAAAIRGDERVQEVYLGKRRDA